jgi:hypothetical protein
MRRRYVVTLISAGAALAIAAGGTAIASSTWFVPKAQVTLRIKSVQMPAGRAPSASSLGGNAVVSWSAQEIAPGVLMQQYIVSAHDTNKTNPLANVVHTVTASGATTDSTTFTAAELAGAKWQFGIIPKFELWTGPEGKLSKDRVSFPAAPSAGVLAAIVAPAPDPGAPPTAVPAAAAPKPDTTTFEQVTGQPTADPTMSAPEESQTAGPDPSPSEAASEVDPVPSGSASE